MMDGTFRGGYRFQGFAGQPENILVQSDVPPKAAVPLCLGARPSVGPGDRVYAGQIIARGDDTVLPPIISSISGKVLEVGNAVIIEGDGNDGYKRLDGYSLQWEKLPLSQIEKLLCESGAAALGMT